MAGSYSVGKTSLIVRYCDDAFSDEYHQTIGANFYIKEIDSQRLQNTEDSLKLFVWDICGQIDKLLVTEYYFQGAAAAIIVFDLTKKQTFDNIDFWINTIKSLSGDIPFVIVGNKTDLVKAREVPKELGEQIAAKYSVPYFEASAKENSNVDLIFNYISDKIMEKVK